MKFAGVFIIIMAAFTLGYSRRKTMLKGERLLMQLRSLAGVIRSNIEFEYDSPLRCIGRAAAGEGASCLEFLSDALKKTDEGAALCDALRDAFGEWEDRNAMSLEVGEDVAEYFGAL
ncbi:MAG: hypothetical protein RRY38_03675, partial [Oscillospiraceae bacterium]